MRSTYLYIIYNYGPLLTCILSLFLLTLLWLAPSTKNALQRLSLSLLVLTTLISLEFYFFQISTFPLNLILPIGVIMVLILKSTKNQYTTLFTNIITIIITLYLSIGLIFLSSSANTWGDGSATYGTFIVSNSLMILLSLYMIQQKFINLFMMCKLFIAIVGIIMIYYSTNGFHYGEFDGDDVYLRRNSSILICAVSLLESILLYLHKKRIHKLVTA